MFVRGSFLEGKFRCWEQIRYCGSRGKPDFYGTRRMRGRRKPSRAVGTNTVRSLALVPAVVELRMKREIQAASLLGRRRAAHT